MILCTWSGPSAAGPAIGQFEIKKVATEAGDIELQSLNAYTWGQPSRAVAGSDPDYVFDENSVAKAANVLELEVSWTDWLRTRVGIEFEKERIDDPETLAAAESFAPLTLTEFGFESVVVLAPIDGDGVGLAWLTEFEVPRDNAEQKTLLMGPLVEMRKGKWRALLNLFLIRFMGGAIPESGARDNKWDFGYAAQIKYDHSQHVSLALEAYGTVDRLGRSGTPSDEAVLFGDDDQHRLGPVLYYSLDLGPKPNLGGLRPGADHDQEGENASALIGIGGFVGLTDSTPDATLKLSFEVDF